MAHLSSTHLAQWQVVLFLLQEVDVSRGDDAHQLAAHLSVVCDGDSTEAVASLGLEDVSNALVGTHHHWVCDEALLIALAEGGEAGDEERAWKKAQGSRRVCINGK